MTVSIAPNVRQQYLDANGNPYSGAKLFTYLAGSSTKQTTYTDSTGATPNTNPIILNASGRTPYGVWLTDGSAYKIVLAPATDSDPPVSPIYTEDNVSGSGAVISNISEWLASGFTPTYVAATQFSVLGNQTLDYHVGRRVSAIVTAGTVYGYITASSHVAGVTTVTLVIDNAGVLDAGLTAVSLGVLSSTNPSIPAYQFKQNQSTADGGGQIYLNNPTANRIDFNINGLGAPAFTTRSLGTKICLFPGVDASHVDWGFGIATGELWSSVATNSGDFTWYGGTSLAARLTGAGTFTSAGGIVSSSPSAGIGYSTGSGGTVIQISNKATGVTLNTMCGTITMNNAALAANTAVTFNVVNTGVTGLDCPIVTIKSGATAGAYCVTTSAIGAGSYDITLRNLTAGSLSEAVVLRVAILRSVNS